MRISKIGWVAAACACAGVAMAGEASAVSLYWAKVAVKTPYPKICMSFARDSMTKLGLQNIRVSADEVAGSNKVSYAAITCVGTANKATAVIMVASDDNNNAIQVRDQLRDKISKMQQID